MITRVAEIEGDLGPAGGEFLVRRSWLSRCGKRKRESGQAPLVRGTRKSDGRRSALRWPLAAGRFPQSAFRFPLAAFRWPLSAGRFPQSAFRFPLSAIRFPQSAFRLPLA